MDAERPMSLGERQTSNSLSSLGSDVLKMMKDAGLDAPTSFFNTIEEKEVNEKELTFVYSERNYYASNGASGKYESHFSMSMRLMWNDEDKTERDAIKDIHNNYIVDFKKKNSK